MFFCLALWFLLIFRNIFNRIQKILKLWSKHCGDSLNILLMFFIVNWFFGCWNLLLKCSWQSLTKISDSKGIFPFHWNLYNWRIFEIPKAKQTSEWNFITSMHHLSATRINLACFYLLLIVKFIEMTAQLGMFMIYRCLLYAQEIKFIDRHFIHSTFPSSFDSRHTIDIFPIREYFSIRFLWLASFRNYKYIGWPPGSCREGMQLMFGTISSSVAKVWCIIFCLLLSGILRTEPQKPLAYRIYEINCYDNVNSYHFIPLSLLWRSFVHTAFLWVHSMWDCMQACIARISTIQSVR